MSKAHSSKHDNLQLEVRDSGRETRDSGLQTNQGQLFNEKRPGTRDSGPVTCLGLTFESDEARRSYFLEKLREKLKDPEFREIEGFPVGEDEDILRLSDPPYYTACPNPFLRDFVEYFKQLQPSQDAYRKELFAADVSEGKHDPLYKAHTYHTKVPLKAIAQFIEHYTKSGDVILDPYCGSGMTGVAGKMVGDRLVVQCDLSPAATHIAAGYASDWNVNEFRDTARTILAKAKQIHQRNFQAIEDGSYIGDVMYWVWSDVLICDSCEKEFLFADAAVDLDAELIANEYDCPHCKAKQSKASAKYAHETIFDPYLRRPIAWNRRDPFWIVYRDRGGDGSKDV